MEKDQILNELFEIEPLNTDQFLKVKETLTRIGIASRSEGDEKTLWQSCHVLQKKGKYYICHFKQMFLLDGRMKSTNFTDDDYDRLEYVVALLEEWGLVMPVLRVQKPQTHVVVIPFGKKNEWDLRSKYTVGGKQKYGDKDGKKTGN